MARMVVTSLFFMWGFLTCLNDILIPHLKATFSLNYAQSMLIQFTFFGAYFLMSLPAGKLVARVGYKHGIIVGLAIAGVGALLFWPAAQLRVYELFLGALFVLATGITVLQVAANPYMTLLGPERTASSRLNLAQAFNSLGTAIAPLLGRHADPDRCGARRGAVGGAVGTGATRLPDAAGAIGAGAVHRPGAGVVRARRRGRGCSGCRRSPPTAAPRPALGVLRHRHVALGVVAIFVYVGAEVAIGSFLVNYLSQPEIGAMTEQHATRYVSAYWTGAMVGRFIGSALLLRIDPGKLLAVFAGDRGGAARRSP